MKKSVLIVGGGITGLVSGYLAAKKGHSVTILEAGNEVGGLLKTFEIGNNELEIFYHHFFTHDVEIHWLLEQLELSDKLIYKKSSMGVFRNSRIYPFDGPVDLLKFEPFSFLDIIRFAWSTFFLGKFAKWEKNEGVSTYHWFRTKVGGSVLKNIWGPLLKIKFGPFYESVPLSWMIGRLRQRMKSRKNGDERLGYLKGSLATLLKGLRGALEDLDVNIVTNEPVTSIEIEKSRVLSVVSDKKTYAADQFLFTIPTTYLSKLLETVDSSSSEKLREIEYFGATCVIFDLKKRLSNIYWTNIADEGYNFGGVIEHTNFIPPENYDGKHIAYFSRYFSQNEEFARLSDDELKAMATSDLYRIYPSITKDDINEIFLFTTKTAATVCDLDFSNKVPSCKTHFDNMFIASMPHIYPDERSVNNSIRIAANAMNKMEIHHEVPNGNSMSGVIGFD